jgi:hypothetical protein
MLDRIRNCYLDDAYSRQLEWDVDISKRQLVKAQTQCVLENVESIGVMSGKAEDL